jgi:hypothetical protein
MIFTLSGVVMKISGGLRMIRARSEELLSPLRSPMRISGSGSDSGDSSVSSLRICSRGVRRFREISLFRAFSGEMYRVRPDACPDRYR